MYVSDDREDLSTDLKLNAVSSLKFSAWLACVLFCLLFYSCCRQLAVFKFLLIKDVIYIFEEIKKIVKGYWKGSGNVKKEHAFYFYVTFVMYDF